MIFRGWIALDAGHELEEIDRRGRPTFAEAPSPVRIFEQLALLAVVKLPAVGWVRSLGRQLWEGLERYDEQRVDEARIVSDEVAGIPNSPDGE